MSPKNIGGTLARGQYFSPGPPRRVGAGRAAMAGSVGKMLDLVVAGCARCMTAMRQDKCDCFLTISFLPQDKAGDGQSCIKNMRGTVSWFIA